jgi:glycerol-3-phosphate dehydrogenase subunit B
VIVIGGGVAGSGAALAAAAAGATVLLIDGGSGASTLSTGAVDAASERSGRVLPAPVAARGIAKALGTVVPERGARVLTSAGIARWAGGHDAALLDVSSVPAGRIGVVVARRSGWDASWLARAWGERFGAFQANLLRHSDEEHLPDAELAARHDDPARLAWLADRIRTALAQSHEAWSGIVVPPLLGLDRPQAAELSRLVGVRCGEAIGLPGGPSGLRFENARDRALIEQGVERVRDRAQSVRRAGSQWQVVTEAGTTFAGTAVVLAAGGLIGGGIAYAPSEATVATALPAAARLPLRATVDAPVTLGAYGRMLEVPGSLFGMEPEGIASSMDGLLYRGGVLTAESGAAIGNPPDEPRGLFVAGEMVADAARTWLESLASGVRAGQAASRHGVTGPHRSEGLDSKPASPP